MIDGDSDDEIKIMMQSSTPIHLARDGCGADGLNSIWWISVFILRFVSASLTQQRGPVHK